MLANLIPRGFQIVFGAVVLGLSVTAIEWQWWGTAPATSSYSAFAGAFGIFAGLVGIAAAFFEVIPQLIMGAVDALSALLLLAGGVVSTTQHPRTSRCCADFCPGFCNPDQGRQLL